MAFKKSNDNEHEDAHTASMREALSQSSETKEVKETTNTNGKRLPSSDDMILNIPKKEKKQKKKNYTFSLYPEVREEIDRKAEEFNYGSSSELLNELFKPNR